MKGLIFTDFLEMVGTTFSPVMVEKIIDASDLPNEGAYTDIGTYDYREIIRLVTNLSKETGIPVPELEIAYGKYLFSSLFRRYESLVKKANSTFEFLQQVDQHIHVEVLKLYPDAELPRFECSMINPRQMTMKYHSNHPFANLAEGLILGCATYFNETIHIEKKDMGPSTEKTNNVIFTLTKQD